MLPLFISSTITEFSVTFLWLSTTESKNIVKLLAITQTRQFQIFSTNLPSNFWKIAQLLGKIANTIGLRFISLPFPSKKSSSEWTCPYWQWIVWKRAMTGTYGPKVKIHAVCCEDNYFPKRKFSVPCFFFPISLPCVICGTYVTRIDAVSWHIAP